MRRLCLLAQPSSWQRRLPERVNRFCLSHRDPLGLESSWVADCWHHCTAALVAAALLGPRINRFDSESGESRGTIPGHSVPLVSLGGFILFFGFLAFNGGSQLHIQQAEDGASVAKAMVNTVLSGSTAAFTTLMLTRIRSPHWSLLRMINGGLAGMVAICAGCNVIYPWGACVMGFFAACSYMAWSELVLALKIDDPVDAISVHYGGGIWGVIGVAFLRRDRGILFYWNQQSGLDLAMQLVGVLTAYGHGWKEDNAVPEIGFMEPAMSRSSHNNYKPSVIHTDKNDDKSGIVGSSNHLQQPVQQQPVTIVPNGYANRAALIYDF